MLNTRRHLITVTDAESREVIIFTGTDWTAEQRQIAIATILGLVVCQTTRPRLSRLRPRIARPSCRAGYFHWQATNEAHGPLASRDASIISPASPADKKRLSRGHNAAVWTTMKSGKPIILVVEDEVLVRMMAVRVAEYNGFEALSAASADEAIMILESRTDIRLVFTDVNMPGSMDGLRLAYAVRGRWPPVEILVTSALSNLTAKDLPERGRFLPKPYDDATLSKAFQQMAGD